MQLNKLAQHSCFSLSNSLNSKIHFQSGLSNYQSNSSPRRLSCDEIYSKEYEQAYESKSPNKKVSLVFSLSLFSCFQVLSGILITRKVSHLRHL